MFAKPFFLQYLHEYFKTPQAHRLTQTDSQNLIKEIKGRIAPKQSMKGRLR